MKPSNFTKNPIGSVLQKSEAETIARNIMVILSRTGDAFRPLTWLDYKNERLKDDKDFSNGERAYFDQVIGYCKDASTASLFSPVWKKEFDAAKGEGKQDGQTWGDKFKELIPPAPDKEGIGGHEWELDFIESALNHYWNDANINLGKKDLGDIERKNYEKQLAKSKQLMQQIDSKDFYLLKENQQLKKEVVWAMDMFHKENKIVEQQDKDIDDLKSIAKRAAFWFGNEANYPEGTQGYIMAKDAVEILNRLK